MSVPSPDDSIIDSRLQAPGTTGGQRNILLDTSAVAFASVNEDRDVPNTGINLFNCGIIM